MSHSETPLSFSAEQLLGRVERRAGAEGGQAEPGGWLLALLDENRAAAEEAGGQADLDALASAARDRVGSESGEALTRAEIEERASRRAAEQSHAAIAPADLAYAILDAQPAPPPGEEVAGEAAEAAKEPAVPGETPDVPLSFGAEQLLASLVGDPGASAGLYGIALRLLESHREVAEEAGVEGDLANLLRDQLEQGSGEPVARDDLARDAARHAREAGHDVVAPVDVAAPILAAVRDLAAPAAPRVERAPAPERPPGEERIAPSGPRTFRVFVSSTFTDLEEERNALRPAFERLREFCAEHDARFQPIDLRWGVSEEASLDQQAMNICLGEIQRCREVTPRPNFLVLLGNRYGWHALPPQIPEQEFAQILDRVAEQEGTELLSRWYQRDANAVPVEYRLRPRVGDWAPPGHPREEDFPDRDQWRQEELPQWEEAEARLRETISAAIDGLELGEGRRPVYESSATEREITAGALETGAPEGRAFCFAREIELEDEDPDPAEAGEGDPVLAYVDADQAPLEGLKAKLAEAGVPIESYPVLWDRDRDRPDMGHLDKLAADVEAALKSAIGKELQDRTEPPAAPRRPIRIEPHEHLDADGRAHRDFADERIRFFVGRMKLLGGIGEYLAASDPYPLVIHGGGGTGKSALLAEALRKAQDVPETQLVYRFIGATPGSADGRGLLAGICRELARRYGADESEVPSDYQELSSDFRERLGSASAERPLYLFIDSLDQLSPSQGARRLTWLPDRLPEHVRLVVSTRPGETLEPLRHCLESLEAANRLVEVGPLESADGDELLALWLDDARRALTEEQREAVLDAFREADGNPLYLRLAFEEARRWISDEDPETLETGKAEDGHRPGAMAAIIEGNTFARLADEQNHGEAFVAHALGYLATSRHGLSEDELVELLSRDPDVYRWFLLGSYHVPLDLRERLDEHLSGKAKRELRAAAKREKGSSDEVAEWVRQIRDGERDEAELDELLAKVLPRGGTEGMRLPIVLWSRLYADLRPYLTERAYEDAILIAFYHRELGEVATRRYLEGEVKGRPGVAEARGPGLHGREADYFRPERDGDGRPRWSEATRHALSELPYQLAEAGEARWDELTDTLTDFGFLAEKAQRVGRLTSGDAEGQEATTYTGVFLLQDDYDRALRAVSGGEEASRPSIIVTATDFGEGLVVRCPHCNSSHELTPKRRKEWLGNEIQCPNESCQGPLKVNEFVVERRS